MAVQHRLPPQLDSRDADFRRQCRAWALEAQRDAKEIISKTKETIATSKALMAEADRILAQR